MCLHPQFSGIKVGPTEHRISLYADDIILSLSNIKKSIPTLLELIKSFGDMSGYKVNKTKSSMLSLNVTQRNYPVPEVTQFSVVEQFKYLGVQTMPKLELVAKVNCESLMIEINESLQRWMSLPMSIIGRINILKSNILPKLLIPKHSFTTTFRFILKN